MKIRYDYGPDRVWIGEWEFKIGEIYEVDEAIATSALREPTLRFSSTESGLPGASEEEE